MKKKSNKMPGSSMTYAECRYFQSDGIRKPRYNHCEYLPACELDYDGKTYQYELKFEVKKDMK